MTQVLISQDEYAGYLKHKEAIKNSYQLNKDIRCAISRKEYTDPIKRARKLLKMKEYRAKKKLEKINKIFK